MAIPDYLEQVVDFEPETPIRRVCRTGRAVFEAVVTIMIWAMMDFLSAVVAGLIAFRIRLEPVVEPTSHSVLAAPGARLRWFRCLSVGVQLVPGVFARIYGVYRSPEAQRTE